MVRRARVLAPSIYSFSFVPLPSPLPSRSSDTVAGDLSLGPRHQAKASIRHDPGMAWQRVVWRLGAAGIGLAVTLALSLAMLQRLGLEHSSWLAAVVALPIAIAIPLLSWALDRPRRSPTTPSQLEAAAAMLRAAVRVQWRAEAANREVQYPEQLPVHWKPAAIAPLDMTGL